MAEINWDDPDVEAEWFAEQRANAEQYLAEQRIVVGSLEESPAWAVAPYVALWRAVGARSGQPTYWTITGDLPTDFLPFDAAATPRAATAAFAERWQSVSRHMLTGKDHPTIQIGSRQDRVALGDLLHRRATLLSQFASDDDNW